MNRLTIVVPVHNEEGNIFPLFERVRDTIASLKEYNFEILFIDDGSTDDTALRLQELAERIPAVRYVELSRNFGKEAALSAGLSRADGDAVILMDGDLQHPPALIPALVTEWEKGADVVIGVRAQNPDEGFIRKVGSRFFSYLMRQLSEVPSVPQATDFRLLDRTVAEQFNRFTEHGRITRGLIDWLGFRRAYVPFDAAPRHSGTAQYGYRRLINLALSALISHSLVPLKLAGYLGALITLCSGLLGIFIIIEQLMLGDPLHIEVSGTAMLAVMILFLNGIVLVSLGLVSVYIAHIHREAVSRPLFVERTRRPPYKRS